MRAGFVNSLAVVFFLAGAAAADPQVVTVQADGDLGPFPALASGFLHGKDAVGALDPAATATLDPEFWRLSKVPTYDIAASLDAKVCYEIYFSYAYSHGGPPNAHPWENWGEWEQYVASVVTALHFAYPEDRPVWYDIWNEPDLSYFWSGSYAQLLELFARTIPAVRSAHPAAKFVGPSVARYDPSASGIRDLVQFAIDLDQQYGVRLDALSWHENDSGVFGNAADKPEVIPEHAESIRTRLAQHFPPDYQPELHVNEYAGNRVHLSPGYNVGYLYYLMEAGIDRASRACWNVHPQGEPPGATYSDCWSGLDGLFMDDGFTPQIVYWIYEAAVRMRGGTRLPTTIPVLRTNALASRIDTMKEVRIVLGRHQQARVRDVLVRVEGWPWPDASVHVEAARIPHFPELFEDPPTAIPWPGGPVDAWSAELPVVDGAVEVPLDAFEVGDAWTLVLFRGLPTSIREGGGPAPGLSLQGASPNPFEGRTEIRFSVPRPSHVVLDMFDVRGRRVVRLLERPVPAGQHRVSWGGSDDATLPPPGIYFVRLTDGSRIATMKVIRGR